jgi:hypothetical protein
VVPQRSQERDASIVRQSLHQIAIQNTLLKSRVEGMFHVVTAERRRDEGKSLDLLQHYEY